MSWMLLLLSSMTEVIAVIFIKLSNGFSKWKPTVVVIVADILTFYLLSLSLISLPVSTAYSVWTGVSAAGTVLFGMIFFQEKRNKKKIISLLLIMVSVIGLKLIG